MMKKRLIGLGALGVFTVAIDGFVFACVNRQWMVVLSWAILCIIIFAAAVVGGTLFQRIRLLENDHDALVRGAEAGITLMSERIIRLENRQYATRQATIQAIRVMSERIAHLEAVKVPQPSPPPPTPPSLRTMPTPAKFIPLEALIHMAEEMEKKNRRSGIPDMNFVDVAETLRKRLEAGDPHGTRPEIRARAEQLLLRLSKQLN